MRQLSVIDFFCGAGGFSEGFRQQGFEIILGIDCWDPAIKTFNHNFNLNCTPKNILEYENSTEEIDKLPDTDIIIGSPPCVSFSSSNKSGKADKTIGVRLTEVFLRIIAVKKNQPNSKLRAWFMENVSNSVNYLNDYYTFKDLNLSKWARKHKINPNKKALVLKNRQIINSADFGSPQIRSRVISGELVKKRKLVIPAKTHKPFEEEGNLPSYITLKQIKRALTKPNSIKSNKIITDPLYNSIKIKAFELSDHFYDTGLYKCEWKQSNFLKTNHPYMGKMAFPENENKPSRTITATKIGTSREAIIYKSEFNRNGNGEYRTPTIREAASLMGFPITYQFFGSEGVKCKLVGNSVCPLVSRAFAKQVRKDLGLKVIKSPKVVLNPKLNGIENLNSYSVKRFNNPPRRNSGSRFRRHLFKDGNITVTFSNYDIKKNGGAASKWLTSVQYGNGDGFPTFNYPDTFYTKIEPILRKFKKGDQFVEFINNGFSEKVAKSQKLQEMYELQRSAGRFLEPTELMEELSKEIEKLNLFDLFIQNEETIFKQKSSVPLKQIFALYAINRISFLVNN